MAAALLLPEVGHNFAHHHAAEHRLMRMDGAHDRVGVRLAPAVVMIVNAAVLVWTEQELPDSLGWGPVEDLGADIMEGVRRRQVKGRP